MTRGLSPVKVAQWTERLERYECSGLTVVQFCRQEGVSSPTFYQWRRKLALAAGSDRQAVSGGRRSPRTGVAKRAASKSQWDSTTEMAASSSFRPVRLTAGPEGAVCLTVRLPGGVELAVTDHLPVIEMVVAKLLAQAGDKPVMGEYGRKARREVRAC